MPRLLKVESAKLAPINDAASRPEKIILRLFLCVTFCALAPTLSPHNNEAPKMLSSVQPPSFLHLGFYATELGIRNVY